TTHSVDQSNTSANGFIFYEQGVLAPNVTGAPANSLNPSPLGLPSNRTLASIVNPSVTFQLQPYGTSAANNNNSLIIEQTVGSAQATGTLTLTTPASFRSISVVDVAGSGAGTFTITANFVGGTSTTFQTGTPPTNNFTAPDWFNNT